MKKQKKTVVYSTEDIAKKAAEDQKKYKYKPNEKQLAKSYASYVKWYKDIQKKIIDNTEAAIGKENMVPGKSYMKEKMFTREEYDQYYIKTRHKLEDENDTVKVKSINRTLARKQGFELSEKQQHTLLMGYKNYKLLHPEDTTNLKIYDIRYNPEKRDAWNNILQDLTDTNGKKWVSQNIFGSP